MLRPTAIIVSSDVVIHMLEIPVEGPDEFDIAENKM